MATRPITPGVLSDHLRERSRPLNGVPLDPSGRFVICWLHHAVRGHENPVLDAAIELGNALDRPVLVYQGLGGRHRFNSDRHHAFILEGARDLEAELAGRGVAFAFSLPDDPEAPSPLRGLLGRAVALVTEDFPAPPMPRWADRLSRDAPCLALAVDGACIAPLRMLDERFARAFAFREAARSLWNERIDRPWIDAVPTVDERAVHAGDLGFEPLSLHDADIAELCAACEIDHGVPPVPTTPGGSTAGYARWTRFKELHLDRYDQRRNDAADMDAVSGLSPYLHHGHVSPFRIAREARAQRGSGATKFLDELLTWRELAFNFCAHTPEQTLETLEALPEWAQRTVAAHADDDRDAIHSWETLSRGMTRDALWDSAQRSLLRNGELHNNMRMTWGKMLPVWSRTPADALRLLIDLNHRFALDGSDPNSYGGLLWCLGAFDRPHTPERSVLGTVRGRDTSTHARRLAPARYAGAVRNRGSVESPTVAVIGAGISGLTCARQLRDHGCTVRVFDRGRGAGGRMSTRRATADDGQAISFDHGAPFFTVDDPRFGRFVRSWIDDGVCARWSPRVATWTGRRLAEDDTPRRLCVGLPGMNAICRHLANAVDVSFGCTVRTLERDGGAWRLHIERGDERQAAAEGPFEFVVVAAPPPQIARLAPPGSAIADGLADVTMEPTWIAMIGASDLPPTLPEVIHVANDPAVALLVRDDSKPGRRSHGPDRWIAHATPGWSAARYDAPHEDVGEELTTEAMRVFSALSGVTGRVAFSRGHRWGLARPAASTARRCLVDLDAGLVACGEGLGGAGVEAAFLGGQAAAARMLAQRRARSDGPAASLFSA